MTLGATGTYCFKKQVVTIKHFNGYRTASLLLFHLSDLKVSSPMVTQSLLVAMPKISGKVCSIMILV